MAIPLTSRVLTALALGAAALGGVPAGAQPGTGAAASAPAYEFSAADWPGTREQAARLAAEARDPEWAPSMEQLLTQGLDGLVDVDYQGRRIACRTTLCGIAFDFSIADPRGEHYTETRQIREMFVGSVKAATERVGTDGLSYDFSAAYDVNGAWTGKVGITVRRRAPTSEDLLLALPAAGDERE